MAAAEVEDVRPLLPTPTWLTTFHRRGVGSEWAAMCRCMPVVWSWCSRPSGEEGEHQVPRTTWSFSNAADDSTAPGWDATSPRGRPPTLLTLHPVQGPRALRRCEIASAWHFAGLVGDPAQAVSQLTKAPPGPKPSPPRKPGHFLADTEVPAASGIDPTLFQACSAPPSCSKVGPGRRSPSASHSLSASSRGS